MGIIKINIEQEVANTPQNLAKVHDYIAANISGGHRIYRGNFDGFSLYDLLMMLGFTALHSKKPRDVIKIKKLSCYEEDKTTLLSLIFSMNS